MLNLVKLCYISVFSLNEIKGGLINFRFQSMCPDKLQPHTLCNNSKSRLTLLTHVRTQIVHLQSIRGQNSVDLAITLVHHPVHTSSGVFRQAGKIK